jgi:hypothetical protein
MANFSSLRGMLLEEAILYLLRVSGYKTIESADGDETLENHVAGLAVKGRGGKHQIDAIADFKVTPPFSYPQRLLLEAKCYNRPIGIDVTRNAFGVLRDVEEHWVPSAAAILKKRFHYQYAIASINGFSEDAQQYAYAHDLYLLALERASYFQPIADAINAFSDNNQNRIHLPRNRRWLHNLRIIVRGRLRGVFREYQDEFSEELLEMLDRFYNACSQVERGVIALLNGRFPVMLIPSQNIQLDELQEQRVRIYRGNEERGWFIRTTNGRTLFSFDVPQAMFNLYAVGGELTRERALDLKTENMDIMQLIITIDNRIRIINLRLDEEWINQLRQR